MRSDRTTKNIPVEHEFTFYGRPARVLIELETRRGFTVQVPFGDLATFTEAQDRGYSEVRVPIRGSILRRIGDACDDVDLAGL